MAEIVKKVIVIGGGIGGLCTAIALRRIGVAVAVYERAEVLSQVGAGLTVWANAVKVLRKLGLADAVIEAGSKIERGEIRTASGRTLPRKVARLVSVLRNALPPLASNDLYRRVGNQLR